MKKIITFVVCLQIQIGVYAQQEFDTYRRNSLCTYFVTDAGNVDRSAMNIVDFVCQNYKISCKFDSHDIGLDKTIQVRNIKLDENNKPKRKKGFIEKLLGSPSEEEMAKIREKNRAEEPEEVRKYMDKIRSEEELPYKFAQFLENNKIANKLIAKWFNASDELVDGSYYNMKLIQERGIYSASELEKLRASESVRGRAVLADAGMELLSHTYVTFTIFYFTTSQEGTRQVTDLGNKIIKKNTVLSAMWNKAGNDNIKELSGYGVEAVTFLFKLKWDSTFEDIFINKYYNAPVSSLLNSDEFEMEYLGDRSSSISYEIRTGEGAAGNVKLAGEATIRAIDKSLGSLQREFEDFKIKAPLIDVGESGITAFIGTKEGVTGSSTFDVLERVYNSKRNIFEYKKVTTLKIDKSHPIFDNRYVLGQEEEPVGKTYFKGDYTKLAPGMLLIQKK